MGGQPKCDEKYEIYEFCLECSLTKNKDIKCDQSIGKLLKVDHFFL